MHGTIEHAATRAHRVPRRRNEWTLREHEVVVEHWPDIETIRQRLPHRSTVSIKTFAGRCNLRHAQHEWTTGEVRLLRTRVAESVPQKQIAREMGLAGSQVESKMRHLGLRYEPRPPAPVKDPLANAIRMRAFHLKMTIADLDRSLVGDKRLFRYAHFPNQTYGRAVIEKAVKALGGTLTVQWHDE